ncbi:MAG: thiamine pyrophosphate-requiring protein [SAR202 cluster bacterium]|jgi:acetolactate synthase-1/2/3 large subunit|nr:MAG: thiamine pyrophosphate-requiring protein [SAR202 cluster bacterium]KAA1304110.1 MAG: thiamine pyrophosphate-requiring protein [SAR202 cluster bacterium]MEC8986523.1 thiamine pyrophosphate-requiring protein [Chloroflexota bacterium]MED5410428.1 thiamine pyrophosphate-requiring protein [Chloroflexota bacterium]MED5449821.1 thiamine pyrophosphate-requiring protein [Chloroflexota bacterium]|tara:strand:+ start:2679 stop:4319 length:1641 start_codon:yes stop_codon:yes gene_type:complete
MKVLDAVARILKAEGIEWAGCFPSNNLIEAVAEVGINPIMFRQERGAAMAVDGFSRMRNREEFGVLITQGGPGSENTMGGLAQAYADNVPILYLPGGPAVSARSVKPNFSPARTYESVSVSAEVLFQPNQVASVMRRAFHALRNGRPGPVIVEIPADVGEMEVDDSVVSSYAPPKRHRFAPDPAEIKEAVRLLLAAKKPVIWSGMGVLMSGASPELTQLAEIAQIPVYCTMPGKSGFDQRHPLALGSGSSATSLQARTWLQESDVLLGVGTSLTRTGYGQPIPDGKVMIHNTETVADLNKDFNVDVGLVGDTKLTLEMMVEEVKVQLGGQNRKGSSELADQIAEINDKWMAEWSDALTSDETPITPYRVIGEMINVLDQENSIVTHDAGAPRDIIMPFYPGTVPHSYVGWGKTTHLGYGIPLMTGVKMACPDKFCMNIMGDGAFGMSGLDIETSVRSGAAITTIVLNNGGMATYPGGYPTARESFGTTYMTGDYAKIAEGLGAVGITVTKPEEIAPALEQAKQLNADGKAVLIDVHSNMEARRSNF